MLKQLKIVWAAIIIGLLLFIVLCVYLNRNGFETIQDKTQLYYVQLIAIILLLSGLLLTRFYSRRKVTALTGTSAEKLSAYRRIFIINLAVAEATGFFSSIGYLLFGSSNLLLLGLISLMLLLTYFPSAMRVSKDLGIPADEIETL